MKVKIGISDQYLVLANTKGTFCVLNEKVASLQPGQSTNRECNLWFFVILFG